MPAIVQVNVSETVAPTPITLQSTGALLSQGGTSTAPGTMSLLTQASDFTPIMAGALPLASITQVTGTATATASAAHGFTIGDTLMVTIAGATPAAYNGTHLVTVTTTTAFTFAVATGTATPATGTLVYTVSDVAELFSMVNSYFGQGGQTAVFVLELGPGNVNDGVAFLAAWITANPNGIAYGNGFFGFYSYLVPREWDANTNFLAFLATFEAPSAKTYFWVTTTVSTYTMYSVLMKDVLTLIEAPVQVVSSSNRLTALITAGSSGTATVVEATTTNPHGLANGDLFQIVGCVPAAYNGFFTALNSTTQITSGNTIFYLLPSAPGTETTLGSVAPSFTASSGIAANEFSMAAPFNAALSLNPAGGFVPPFGYTFLFGVTPFPTFGNQALLATLAAANVNVVGTGAEGGISNAILLNGKTMDGNSFNWWYSIDNANINLNLNLSNAVINGSNDDEAPLYLNQAGINALQGVCASTMAAGVTAGLVLGTIVQTELTPQVFQQNVQDGDYAGQCVINAVPFAAYYAANPGQYKEQLYGGFSVSFTPQLGFENILINLNATSFVG